MYGGQPEAVKRVERAVEGMMNEIQRSHIVPKQKEAFLCCAKCCDNTMDMQSLQGWWVCGRGAVRPAGCGLLVDGSLIPDRSSRRAASSAARSRPSRRKR